MTDTTVVQDFDNENALSADYGYGGMTSRNTKFHQSGTAAAVMTTKNQQYSQGTIYCNFDISEVDTLYYYVYFDSESFSDANGVYSKENLPTMNATTFSHSGLTNWDVTAQGEMKWDTWILVKATKKANNTETNSLTVNFHNLDTTWGLGTSYAATGFTYSVYLDSITTVDPRAEA